MSVPKIVEITYAINQGLSKKRLCKEYVGRKVNNASGFNLRRNFAFACTVSLSSRVITWLEPGIQTKLAIWSRNTGQRIPCFDSCHLIITWMSNIQDIPMEVVLLSYFSRNGAWRRYLRTYVRTDNHLRTKIFEIDGLPNFLKYGALLARPRQVGAPLLTLESSVLAGKSQTSALPY